MASKRSELQRDELTDYMNNIDWNAFEEPLSPIASDEDIGETSMKLFNKNKHQAEREEFNIEIQKGKYVENLNFNNNNESLIDNTNLNFETEEKKSSTKQESKTKNKDNKKGKEIAQKIVKEESKEKKESKQKKGSKEKKEKKEKKERQKAACKWNRQRNPSRKGKREQIEHVDSSNHEIQTSLQIHRENDELTYWDEDIDIDSVPTDLLSFDCLPKVPDIIYVLLLHLCRDNPNRVIKRRKLIEITLAVVLRDFPNQTFTSSTAKTPAQTYSASFTKSMRNVKGKTIGKMLGMIECIKTSDRIMWYRPYVVPGKWENVKHIFHQMMEERAETEGLLRIPRVGDLFKVSNYGSVHGYGLFAKKRIPAGTKTYLYYMGGIYLSWEKKDYVHKLSYRFAINGLPYLIIDPTDENGDLSYENRLLFPAACINEARNGQRANCFYTANTYARWQIFIEIGNRDIQAGEELLVNSYGKQDIDPV